MILTFMISRSRTHALSMARKLMVVYCFLPPNTYTLGRHTTTPFRRYRGVVFLGSTMSRRMSHFELKGYLLDMVSGTWATGNNSLQRVYIFFGYDEDLDLGDGMVCSGYRYRLRKQRSSGCWGIVDISASSASAEISAFLGSLSQTF